MLRTPSPEEVAAHLINEKGIHETTARFAAHAAQGHVGRAKALARDESARRRRRDVLSVPSELRDLATCMSAATKWSRGIVPAAGSQIWTREHFPLPFWGRYTLLEMLLESRIQK